MGSTESIADNELFAPAHCRVSAYFPEWLCEAKGQFITSYLVPHPSGYVFG